jgi:ribosome biogenesis GTPase / thiamine phosphate phosphatase
MIEFNYETLRRVGLTPLMAQKLASFEPLAHGLDTAQVSQWMRVTSVHRETMDVHDGTRQHSARVLARLARALQDAHNALAVGDWVLCVQDVHGTLWLTDIVPPITHIVRRDGDGTRHTVVSNVDTALVVMGLDMDFNLQRLERYLALVGSSGVLPVVVLTKADVAVAAGAHVPDERMREVQDRVGRHVDVLAVDARSGEAAKLLAPYVQSGQTLVLLGSSGAGKSTLTNSLLGSAEQDTGAVREHDSRGKHTTTARSLHLLPQGACVIDTPGVRTLRPDVDPHTLGQLFEDITELASQCRFRDCQHNDEPGCAVRAGVSPLRVKNYQKLLRESRRDSLTVLDKRRQLSEWKARSKSGRARAKLKHGDT